jgi:hypothetical protein
MKNKYSAALHMQAKILANAMYGFSTLTTPKGFNLGSYFNKEFELIDDCLPIKYQLIMSVHNATALVNYTNANKNLYCWWTIKHRSGYYAVGPHINKLVIKELELSNDDPIEYFEKGAVVKCDHYKPKMKGGHRHNARVNAEKVKTFRSKTARRMAKYALKYESLTPKQKKRLLSYEPWSNRRIHFHS